VGQRYPRGADRGSKAVRAAADAGRGSGLADDPRLGADFDAWAIADHVCKAGSWRLLADPSRIDSVAGWTGQVASMWTRRAALVITLPWARMATRCPRIPAIRERVLGWAAGYLSDPDWFIQKAVAWWLRDLSKRDPARVRAFLDRHGAEMRGFARREAEKYL
jgi:3-methyladenine DNA glycosylase AlkD